MEQVDEIRMVAECREQTPNHRRKVRESKQAEQEEGRTCRIDEADRTELLHHVHRRFGRVGRRSIEVRIEASQDQGK